MSSSEAAADERLCAADRATLLDVATRSVGHGLSCGEPLPVEPQSFAPALRRRRASFVTLHQDGALRGCIGRLEATRALVGDVSENAWAAAFRDPRFAPLGQDEYPRLTYHVAVLSVPTPLRFTSEQDLLAKLRPGVDGLVLEDGPHRGTFLPAVWENLPEPADFLARLKQKAGLPAHFWSDTVRVKRYTTESFP